MKKNAAPAIGEVFTVPHPFVRDTWHGLDMDEAGIREHAVPTWRPGTRAEESADPNAYYGEQSVVNVADAMGAQELTVVGVYRPGRFPTRVFYTRQWRDPDGKSFGKTKCRISTVPAFRAIVAGYRVPFEMIGKETSLV